MPIINISVREKVARQVGDERIVCDNSDYIAVFDFDAEWTAHDTKTARFYWNGEKSDVVFTGNQCPIPEITNAHGVFVGVYAGDLHTTTAAAIDTDLSILSKGGRTADPLPDVYNQLLGMMNEQLPGALSAADSAAAASGVALAAQNAAEDAQRTAEGAAQSAENAATTATAAAIAAEKSVSNGAYITMSVGEDGHLYCQKTDNATDIDFTLENGHLMMEVNAA